MNKKQAQQFLKEQNLHPIKNFGQNFLVNERLIKTIVQRVQRQPPPYVEIGPGLGALSQHFSHIKKDTLLIERDKKLAHYWKERGWTVICADALKLKGEDLPKHFTLFGNLPYEIASSLIIKSSLQQKQIFNMLIMTQKEVAKRVTASPGLKEFGLLSVISQTFWKVLNTIPVSKTNFYPVPKVNGVFLEFQARQNIPPVQPHLFLKFVKQCFTFKRKKLVKQLPSPSLETTQKVFHKLGLGLTCRAEELKPSQFVELYLQINTIY